MGIDHSLTYKEKSLKTLPHRKRLKEIFSILKKENVGHGPHIKYADIGCSNGFITNLISSELKLTRVTGFDHERTNLEEARNKYPQYDFSFIDLNEPADTGLYDLVTCFETLEHVGNLAAAIDNLLKSMEEGGVLLISVPVEIGFWGIVKFAVKTVFYGYTLDELSKNKIYSKYFVTLLLNKDIGKFRGTSTAWGTHFGFDYRSIDKYLQSKKVEYRATNRFATRFYLVRR